MVNNVVKNLHLFNWNKTLTLEFCEFLLSFQTPQTFLANPGTNDDQNELNKYFLDNGVRRRESGPDIQWPLTNVQPSKQNLSKRVNSVELNLWVLSIYRYFLTWLNFFSKNTNTESMLSRHFMQTYSMKYTCKWCHIILIYILNTHHILILNSLKKLYLIYIFVKAWSVLSYLFIEWLGLLVSRVTQSEQPFSIW